MAHNRTSLGSKWKAKPAGLPLYKEKPLAVSQKRNKIVMLFKGFLLSLVLYLGFYAVTNRKSTTSWSSRQEEVRQVFLESWNSYRNHGWGTDVYHPITETGENMGPKPLGWMIVDSLDTLAIMDLPDQLKQARDWIKTDLNYHFDYEVNVFETTIRMLGGLLSAHHLTKDDLYLDRAVDLANALIGGFESPTGLPYSSVNLLTGKGVKNHVDNGASSTAEVATLQLEFKYLAKLTGEAMFWEKAEKIMEILDNNKPQDGLVPIYVNPDTGKYQGSLIRLGSRGDSYYEYLLKQHLQTKEQVYWDMYRESVAGVQKHLVRKTAKSGLTFIGELERGIGGPLSPKMDHLVCFYGGLLAVGATGGLTYQEAKKQPFWNEERESHFKLGEELTYTCYRMYKDVPTGLSPEIVVFNEEDNGQPDFFIKPLDRHNLQRPETVESLFYLYRLTGDDKYREYGYEIFQSFVQHTKVTNSQGEVSYTSLGDVTQIPPRKRDNLESFWFAETLKYLYLLFDENNKIPLDQYVFNTEAHPFPVFDPEPFATGWRRQFTKVDQEKQMESHKISKKPPQAAPANKPLEEQEKEAVKENPEIKSPPKVAPKVE